MISTYSGGGYIGWYGVEVVEGGGGTPDSEVDGQEEASQDDGERPHHQGEEDVLLAEGGVPTLPGGGALGGRGAVGRGVGGQGAGGQEVGGPRGQIRGCSRPSLSFI